MKKNSTTQPELVPAPEATPPPTNELLTLIENSKVELSTAQSLELAFKDAFTQAKEWEEKAKTIKVTDATQLKEMKLARESRLAIRPIRTGVDKKRKELKADALNYGRAVDACANYLTGLLEPIEEYLLEQEEFAKRIEAERTEAMKQARIAELTPLGVDVQYLDLAGMPEPVYAKLLADSKAAMEARHEEARKAAEAAQKAEQDRIAAEKAEADARELQRLENERLKREAEEREAQLAKERAEMEAKLAEERRLAEDVARIANEKAEYERQVAAQRLAEAEAAAKAERDALEAKAKAEQAKRDAEAAALREVSIHQEKAALKKLAEAQEAREKLEREAKARADAEAAKKKAEADAAKKAAKAPDKTKLVNFAKQVRALQIPDLTTEEGKAVKDLLIQQTERFAVWIDGQATKL